MLLLNFYYLLAVPGHTLLWPSKKSTRPPVAMAQYFFLPKIVCNKRIPVVIWGKEYGSLVITH
jgi:hypothetical protein